MDDQQNQNQPVGDQGVPNQGQNVPPVGGSDAPVQEPPVAPTVETPVQEPPVAPTPDSTPTPGPMPEPEVPPAPPGTGADQQVG